MKPRLRFIIPGTSPTKTSRAVVVITPSNGGQQYADADPKIIHRVVLLEDQDGSNIVELEKAGTYLVELSFPKGGGLRRTVTLKAGEVQTFLVQTRAEQAARMTLPDDLGKAPRLEKFQLGFQTRSFDLLGSGSIKLSYTAPEIVMQDGDYDDVMRELSMSPRFDLPMEILHADGNALEIGLPWLRSFAPYRENDHQRPWMVAEAAQGNKYLISVPGGWGVDRLREAFKLVLHSNVDAPVEFKPHLELLDPQYSAAIEFLNRRDLNSATLLTGDISRLAERMLFGKRENPFAAAVGAYIGALEDGNDDDHPDWMLNLTNWYPWVPDGHVALGWYYLRRGENGSPDWEMAERCFRHAIRAGIPYMTVGLRILLDALSILTLASPDVDTYAPHQRAITMMYWAALKEEPFTTIDLNLYDEMSQRKYPE